MSKRLRGRIKTRRHLLQYFDIDYNSGKSIVEILRLNGEKSNAKGRLPMPKLENKPR